MKRVIFFIFFVAVNFLHGFREGEPEGFSKNFSEAVLLRTGVNVVYDGSYRKIGYPGGDVPSGTGVCTDVLIRSYRILGVDLQRDLHIDLKNNFSKYPDVWGLTKPDTNIDHRRVLNLRVFFSRKGISFPVTKVPEDYLPGDIVSWKLSSGLPHIGVIVDRKSGDGRRYLIVHNINSGPELEDVLFSYRITGHYRYYGNYAPNVPGLN
ncbi:MAG: DUF1287 domain-containing protein [Acidobacteriota bacterium]